MQGGGEDAPLVRVRLRGRLRLRASDAPLVAHGAELQRRAAGGGGALGRRGRTGGHDELDLG